MLGAEMLTVGVFAVIHGRQVKRLVWKTGIEKRKACGQVPKPTNWQDALQGTRIIDNGDNLLTCHFFFFYYV